MHMFKINTETHKKQMAYGQNYDERDWVLELVATKIKARRL